MPGWLIFLTRVGCRLALAAGLLTAARPGVAQTAKRELALSPAGSGARFVPALHTPNLHGRALAAADGNRDGEYRQFRPPPGTSPAILELYAREFDALRHLELKAGAADTVPYCVNVGVLYSLQRTAGGTDVAVVGRSAARREGVGEAWLPNVTHNAWQATVRERLPMGTVALGKGPNGDLYFYAGAASLYRYDPRARRLFESNVALPLLHNANDDWLSISTWRGNLYLINSVGNNLLELAPGRPPRNLLAQALRDKVPLPFVGRPMNMGVGPDRTFYLKENDSPLLWSFTEQDGRLTLAPPVTLAFDGVTTGIEVLPSPAAQLPRLLLGTTGEALCEYDLSTHRVINQSRFISTDLSISYASAAEARWPPTRAGSLRGWYSGPLYVEYAAEPAVSLHFRPGGVIDSVAIAGRRRGVGWYYRQRDDQLEFGADSTFADYVRWHGGGRRAGGSAYAVAFQSSFFAALTGELGQAKPTSVWTRLTRGGRRTHHGAACAVLLTYWAGTEGFAHLTPVRVPPPPPPPPKVPAGPGEPVSDSLICRSGQVLVEVTDYHIVDGDRVQFFLNERPLTGVLRLSKRVHTFEFPCPDPSGMLIMKTIDAAEGPCTALVTIRQGSFEKAIRLEATVARPAKLKFFHRW